MYIYGRIFENIFHNFANHSRVFPFRDKLSNIDIKYLCVYLYNNVNFTINMTKRRNFNIE